MQPRSLNQSRYVEAIEQNDMVFGVGPAGTGKTYLAVAMAVAAINAKRISRIVLVRPAVEAGERLGFLPGTLQEKIDPYLRPLYDALFDMLDAEKVDKMLERNVIEVAPLAFMRGRTLNDAFIILDEAQNTTIEQMKMFLTRMGNNSKAVITGDITQIDLPNPRKSGLLDAINILGGVEGMAFCHFEEGDVVRHPLVQRIVRAYESAKPQQQELPLEGAIAVGGPERARPAGRAGEAAGQAAVINTGNRDQESENDGWDRCDAIPAFAVCVDSRLVADWQRSLASAFAYNRNQTRNRLRRSRGLAQDDPHRSRTGSSAASDALNPVSAKPSAGPAAKPGAKSFGCPPHEPWRDF